ncbi:MAG: hypothetical protein GX811_12410 [Lentisphaerae bacterium]|nr:hypothetical protein [Lentisphaerota bacterium]
MKTNTSKQRSDESGKGFFKKNFLSDSPWILLLIALLVRVPFLGRAPLWQDEIGFTRNSNPILTFGHLLETFWRIIITDGHMPFPYVIWYFYFKFVSLFVENPLVKPLVTRIPALILGIAA